jgi:hypothetical protein
MAIKPMAVKIPMRNAGTARISLTRNCGMASNQSMVVLLYRA